MEKSHQGNVVSNPTKWEKRTLNDDDDDDESPGSYRVYVTVTGSLQLLGVKIGSFSRKKKEIVRQMINYIIIIIIIII